jgi:hypothetical protein
VAHGHYWRRRDDPCTSLPSPEGTARLGVIQSACRQAFPSTSFTLSLVNCCCWRLLICCDLLGPGRTARLCEDDFYQLFWGPLPTPTHRSALPSYLHLGAEQSALHDDTVTADLFECAPAPPSANPHAALVQHGVARSISRVPAGPGRCCVPVQGVRRGRPARLR